MRDRPGCLAHDGGQFGLYGAGALGLLALAGIIAAVVARGRRRRTPVGPQTWG
ncbi:hypothetical protein [Streptomyces sp. MST-110588]|uniref:hypothetical protein n=1 Tax=Streptomyces sp. MST-110588 TaxID=2833628 RepID=UPI001F5E27E3|nr:hypothetical protein [Streptomyces sp. MST-110588]UNO40284.1 hypothetical protein KGS77_12715 [Streptomyces sp. MST-110588]